MLTRSLVLVVLTLSSGWLAGCSSSPATAGAGSARSAQITAVKGLFPVLAKGMTAEVIRQKLGHPADIEPMNSPEGKAEVWVYHFEKTVDMTQVASSTKGVPAFGAPLSLTATMMVQEPVYTMKEEKAVITLSLLMFNGRLEAQKAKVEDDRKYD